MKILTLSISLLLLTGCFRSIDKTPTILPVGTCYETGFKKDLEAWEVNDPYVMKIVEVGKQKYRVRFNSRSALNRETVTFINHSEDFGYVERNGRVVECPVQFSGIND